MNHKQTIKKLKRTIWILRISCLIGILIIIGSIFMFNKYTTSQVIIQILAGCIIMIPFIYCHSTLSGIHKQFQNEQKQQEEYERKRIVRDNIRWYNYFHNNNE